ncbi:class I SAM-dependent methyltransferase, partial [Gilvimarinus sp. 1_MG-2023]
MWDQRYNEEGFAYGTVANDFLQAQYGQILAGGKVLCLAEGEGRNAVFLAKQGYVVTAVDQSSVGLNKAQQLAADNGVVISTVVANLADFDLGTEAWDGIV